MILRQRRPKCPDGLTTDKDLAAVGLTPQDVRALYPWAVEYTGLRGETIFLRDDLLAPEPEGVSE